MSTTEQLKGHVSDTLLQQIEVNHHYIESENPNHHWHLLPVKDETVLDLGCGFHLLESGWETTPEFFKNRGAKKVIGVDPHGDDIEKFKQLLSQDLFFNDCINTTERLNHYINTYDITSLKMDIEGHETCFLDSTENYPKLKHVAIETHSKDLLNRTVTKLIDLNFTISTICTFYPRVFNICNLVYASRE